MKRFYKISGNAESKPMRLLASVVLAFVVMLFINGFIGGMGGFPAFLAFLLVFYLLRTVTSAGNRITHQLAMSSRREVRYLLVDYAVSYLFLWGICRILSALSRVTGWGNINGFSVLGYVKEMLEVPMLEKWADIFAGIVMFAFVLSLFPLLVIREWPQWILYALLDAAGFALFCLGVNSLCSLTMEHGKRARATCLIDHLLLCQKLKPWQEVFSCILVLLFTVAIAVFVYCYSAKVYGPKPGRMDAQTVQQLTKKERTQKQKIQSLVFLLCGILAVCVVIGFVLFMPGDYTEGYTKVAQFLTGDRILGPMEYGGTVYIPVNEEVDLSETGKAQGYLAGRDENCNSRFYQMAVANLLYTDSSGRTKLVQMKGEDEGIYAPVEELEKNDAWEKDTVFLIWDEDWLSESVYSHEPTGYTTCNVDFINGLMMQFPEVTYRAQDFEDYDAYFTIRAYPDMEQVLEDEQTPGDWVGCILVKDNKFYFGSYENQITGISLQQLRTVLGGN